MEIRIDQIDAFTTRPFQGNPAAVVLLDSPAHAAWMQAVAEEMRLSETAFVVPEGDRWGLRWFTPACEVELCGHATLASAHCLWERELVARDTGIRFRTERAGELVCRRDGERIAMDLPAAAADPVDPPPGLLEALGCEAVQVCDGPWDYLVEVASEEIVRGLDPDFRALAPLKERGVTVTARGDGRPFDFVSRFFAPAAGVDEDPVTGSAHCMLASYWQPRVGDRDLHAYQASARGGELLVRLRGDRVSIAGHAVTITRGHLSEAAVGALAL
jgi:PhzF family phenazine biosynthesis protein